MDDLAVLKPNSKRQNSHQQSIDNLASVIDRTRSSGFLSNQKSENRLKKDGSSRAPKRVDK